MDILISDRQMVELVGLVGYYWMVGRMATVFQVELDVAQGTEVYDVGVQLAAHKTSALFKSYPLSFARTDPLPRKLS